MTPVFENVQIIDKTGEIRDHFRIAYPLLHEIYGVLSIFCYSLGFTVFVAGFITNRIQLELRKEKEKQFDKDHDARKEELNGIRDSINQDVFNSLFQTLVPEEIFKVVKQEIIENKILRRNARWYLDFSIEGEKLQLKQTLKYTLENTSNETVVRPFKVQIGLEKGTEIELVSGKYKSGKKETICYPYPDDKKEKSTKEINESLINNITNKGYDKLIEYDISIEPNSQVEATTVIKYTYDSYEIQDQYLTRYPVIGGTLVVTFPENFKFKLHPAFSSPFILDINEATRKTYELNGAILPYQGFIFILSKGNVKKEESLTNSST